MNNTVSQRILHLTLKKKWFDMIASGEKKEEYREVKMYWATRLMNGFPSTFGIDFLNPDLKDYDVIEFKNGYSKNAPVIKVECVMIFIGIGNTEWGATQGQQYFVIRLGKNLTHNQINNE